MLELLYTSTKTITPSGGPYFLAYLSSWDAFLMLGSNVLDKVFRDGTQAHLGTAPSYWFLGSRAGGVPFWNNGEPSYNFYAADEITGQPQYDKLLNPDWQPIELSGDYLDDRLGLYLSISITLFLFTV